MTTNTGKKKSPGILWPGRSAARRRLLVIALVLFPCTWIVNALLIGNWNLLGDRDAESYRHLFEAAFIYVLTVAALFLLSLLSRTRRLAEWLFNWRIIRRGLIVSGWLVTIVVLFYVEEDWRGGHAWTQYREAAAAQGEVLDLKALIPKTIPDADNFAATPEIESWFVRYTNLPAPGYSNSWADDNFARAAVSSDVTKGLRRVTDLVAWQMAFADVEVGQTNLPQNLKSDKLDLESRAKAAPAVLEALKSLDNRLEELRAVSARPAAYYPVIYDLDNPWGIFLPHILNIKSLCQRLDLRACAELAAGDTGGALADVKLMLRLGDSLKQESFLISYMVRMASFQIAIHPVWEGLAEHRWSDAQLKELQTMFERYDFIADLKLPLAGERAGGIRTIDLLANGKLPLNAVLNDRSPTSGSAAKAFGRIMPSGWYGLEKLHYAELFDLQMEGSVDFAKKRAFPDRAEANAKSLNAALGGRNIVSTILVHHQLLSTAVLPTLGNVTLKTAEAQVAADEAVVACALERYRFEHGQFPDKLDALTADFTLPHDVITGEAYKYQRSGDAFVLYSVGWNEKDDGGQVVMKGSASDPKQGDWVWQYPAN